MNSYPSSWRSLLTRIGDRCPEYGGSTDHKEHIDACYGHLSREMEFSKDEILEFLLQCAEQLPHKIPFYGVLVGLINLDDEECVGKVVEAVHRNLQDALYSGECNRIRILMRFVTALMCSKVIHPSSLVGIFETLLSSAATTVDEDVGNPAWQSRADFYVTCILSCLPWGGAELTEQVPEEVDGIMAGVQSYFSIRKQAPETGFQAFESVGGKVANEKDFLEDLWDRIQDLTNSGWNVESVPRPHLQFEAQLVVGKSHDFAPICCPEQPPNSPPHSTLLYGKEKHVAALKYPRRHCRLNIFPASKVEQHMRPIDRFVVEEYLLDVLLFFNGCRKECAAYLVGLPVPFRYEYLMAETIFSQLLLLPRAPFKSLYYTLVIIDLCKALPGAFPSVVAGAVRALFERISDMDMECRTRLILWFSHHLSNLQFFWPWEEWAHVIDLPKWAPERVFVQEVLEREVRLSYWEKIKQSIDNANSLEELLPPRSGPCFKFSPEDKKEMTDKHTLSLELNNMVKGKKSSREISSWVEEKIPGHGPNVAVEVVVQTFLDIGSKSFTHLTTVLERYGQVISALCSDHEKQVMMIDEVNLFWKNSIQMIAVTIDRMMAYRLVSNLAIVAWVFSPTNVDKFHLSDCPWEILTNAVNKTYNRISDLRNEISVLTESVKSAELSAVVAKQEFEAAESKLEVVNGEPVQAEKPGRLKRLKAYAEKLKEELTSLSESLEAKDALLARALEENKVLFFSLYKNFANVSMERLAQVFGTGGVVDSNGGVDEVANDSSESSKMQVDQDDANGKNSYKVGEQEQWCRTILGYVKAFSRQYADEIWVHIDTLENEVFRGVHPLFRRAVYSGLGWLPGA